MTAPHRQPAFRLIVDGTDITTLVSPRLESLSLTDNRGFEADTLDLCLADHDGLLDIPPRGATVQLWLGWQEAGEGPSLEDKGSYKVDEVEHTGAPDKLTLRARSADLRSGLTTKKEKSWHGVTVGNLVRSVAAANGLTPVISKQFDALPIAHLDQTAESDINLLTRLAQEHDAIATVKAGRLLFIAAGQATTASGKPLPKLTLVRASGDQHRFSVADRGGYTAVRAYYNDTKTAERAYARKSNAERAVREEWARINQSGNRKEYTGVAAYYWTDKSKTKKGEAIAGKGKPKPPPPPPTEPSADNVKVLRHTYATKANAERSAKAEMHRLKRGMAQFAIVLAEGRADLFPEIPIAVQGFKREIDSTGWIIVRVTHNLGDGGFTTTLDLEIKPEELDG